MSEETFRPRKPIDPSEVQSESDPLEGVRKMQQQVATESGKEFEGPLGEGGFQTKGEMPEAFKHAMAANRTQSAPATQSSAPQPIRPRDAQASTSETSYSNDDPSLRVTGGEELERLLEGLRPKTQHYEAIELPSRGVFYNGSDGPPDGVLHVRPMTGEEEQILATPRYVKKNLAVDMIFKNCIKETYNTIQLLSQDRTYLLIWLRGISYTPEYEVEVRCPTTETKFTTTVDLNELIVDYCPEDFGPKNLTDTLPNSGYKFEYKFSTGADEQHVTEYRDRQIRMWGDNAADDALHYRTAQLVNRIENLTDKRQLVTLISKLPINDVNYLRNVVTEPPFGVDTKIKIYSPFAMEDFVADLPLDVNFFFPRAKKKKTE